MKEKKEEAIVLLNDGKQSNEEGHCNSWPNFDVYAVWLRC